MFDENHSSHSIMSLTNIGVRYELRGQPRETLAKFYLKVFGEKIIFWALRHINFSIYRGDILAIIGQNGAGKSTLLKVIAETLCPDEGEMLSFFGKKSFISMGMGFRKELSGIENMHLCLQLMGIQKKQLKEKQKEIVEFTQLGQFIHQPMLTYSAGMKARLAFAIATSITPDILIMDEVINTGDELFKEKCKQRLELLLQQAKAVIFCTHNLQSVESLATKVLWIDAGTIKAMGDPALMLTEYRQFIKQHQSQMK